MKILEVLTPNRLKGNIGERAAAKFLKKNGYKILERNFVFEQSEIDIIAKKDDVIAYTEVKARTKGCENPREARPASAVTPEKQRKIIKAASAYAATMGRGYRSRFDIIEVYLENTKSGTKAVQIKHLVGTFDINTAYKGYQGTNKER